MLPTWHCNVMFSNIFSKLNFLLCTFTGIYISGSWIKRRYVLVCHLENVNIRKSSESNSSKNVINFPHFYTLEIMSPTNFSSISSCFYEKLFSFTNSDLLSSCSCVTKIYSHFTVKFIAKHSHSSSCLINNQIKTAWQMSFLFNTTSELFVMKPMKKKRCECVCGIDMMNLLRYFMTRWSNFLLACFLTKFFLANRFNVQNA